MVEGRSGDFDPFEGAEHRDGWGDDAVTVKERRAEQPQQQEQPPGSLGLGWRPNERQQREDTAFTPVVGLEQNPDVLDGDDERHRPENEREDSQYVVVRDREAP